tara:strand:- start:394 stop:585 length:192 start_codon:yes stop_codon:yes gene_type:complete
MKNPSTLWHLNLDFFREVIWGMGKPAYLVHKNRNSLILRVGKNVQTPMRPLGAGITDIIISSN